jgi:aspartyl protease family protein
VVSSDYKCCAKTAGGVVKFALVTLREVRVGGIELADVAAAVSDNADSEDLLGMTFLGRLTSVEQKSGRLVLRSLLR